MWECPMLYWTSMVLSAHSVPSQPLVMPSISVALPDNDTLTLSFSSSPFSFSFWRGVPHLSPQSLMDTYTHTLRTHTHITYRVSEIVSDIALFCIIEFVLKENNEVSPTSWTLNSTTTTPVLISSGVHLCTNIHPFFCRQSCLQFVLHRHWIAQKAWNQVQISRR